MSSAALRDKLKILQGCGRCRRTFRSAAERTVACTIGDGLACAPHCALARSVESSSDRRLAGSRSVFIPQGAIVLQGPHVHMLARFSVLLGRINPTLGELWGIQLCIFIVVTTLTGLFLVGYLLQGTRVGVQLWVAIRRIKALARVSKNVDPAAIAAVLTQRPLSHLWEEYSDTLHKVRQAGDGPTSLAEVRATVPAEMFFTRDALVDGRLFDDFTRHLPGVLTGLGIIGTFLLMIGLLAELIVRVFYEVTNEKPYRVRTTIRLTGN